MPEPQKPLLDRLEQLSKVIGAIAIPVLVALFGWLIQRQLANQNLGRDYVQLAVSILKEPKREDDQQLREWAVRLLDSHSPVKLGDSVSAKLESGHLNLPSSESSPSQEKAIAEQWLSYIDAGDYSQAWQQLGDPRTMKREDFVGLFDSVRRPLGRPLKRLLAGIQPIANPQFPLAQQFLFRTEFAEGRAFLESVVVAPGPMGLRVVSHTMQPSLPQR